jgi:hypothetical protein
MPDLPVRINAKGILTVPVNEIRKYIAIQKADAAHPTIQIIFYMQLLSYTWL